MFLLNSWELLLLMVVIHAIPLVLYLTMSTCIFFNLVMKHAVMDKSHYLLFLTWIKMKNIFHHVNNFLNCIMIIGFNVYQVLRYVAYKLFTWLRETMQETTSMKIMKIFQDCKKVILYVQFSITFCAVLQQKY